MRPQVRHTLRQSLGTARSAHELAAARTGRDRTGSFRQRLLHATLSGRRLNVKLLACLLTVGILIGVGVHFLHGYQVQRNAGVLLRCATRAETKGNLPVAVEYLNRYLARVPQDLDAQAKLGLTLDRLARSPEARQDALTILEQVLRRDPSRHELRRHVVRRLMDLRQFPSATGHLETLLSSAPKEGELHHLLGICRKANGEFAKAAACAEMAIRLSSDLLDGYVHLTGLLRQELHEPERADQVMDEMVAANGQSFRAYLERGHYRKKFRLGGAEEDWQRARQLARQAAPQEAKLLVAAAELARAVNDLDEARDYLRRGIDTHPRHVRLYVALARLELQAASPEAAVACLRQGLKAVPEHPGLLRTLAEALILADELTEAGQVITRLRKGRIAVMDLDYLEACTLLRKEDWRRAAALLEHVRLQLQDGSDWAIQADLFLGLCYAQLGAPKQQLAAYRRAVNRDPLNPVAKLGLVSALLAGGQTDEALDHYRQLEEAQGRQPTPVELWTALSRVAERQDKPERAQHLLDEAVRRLGDQPPLREARARHLAAQLGGLLGEGKADAALPWFARLEQLEPQSFRTQEIKARLLKTQGKDAEAVAVLRPLLAEKETDPGLVVATLEDLGYAAAAEEVHRMYVSRRPRRPESCLILAEYLGRQGRLTEALDLCERAWQRCSPTAVAAVSVGLLHRTSADEKQVRRVERWLRAAVAKQDEEPALLTSLAALRDWQGRYPEAEALYRQILQRERDNPVAMNNLAWLLAFREGKRAEALELINRAITLAGPQPNLLDTRAVTQAALGQAAPAIQDLEEVVAKAPTARRWFHLARAHRLVGNPGAAVESFRKAQALGLTPSRLHPLERTAYRDLVSWVGEYNRLLPGAKQ